MAERRALLSASILDSDLASLKKEVRRAVEAGADRIHLDVMDGHFVPNITFGPGTIKRLRKYVDVPFDAHLMISEPSRYVDRFIDAGCDTVTFHVEVDEPIEPTLRAIRKAGRAPGLALKPATPLTALEPYRELLDIVMVMTVEPGWGGQSFMWDAARKIEPAHDLFRDRETPGQVHVDGGVNRETAEFCGALGVEVMVVGSTLWKKDHDIAREVALVTALADEGYEYRRTTGRLPEPRNGWATFTTLPKPIAKRLGAEIERGGIPVLQVRANGDHGPDGTRDYELLVPTGAEADARERFTVLRAKAEAEARELRVRPAETAAAVGQGSEPGANGGEAR